MMAMDNLNAIPAHESGRADDEAQFKKALGGSRVPGQIERFYDLGKLPPCGPGNPYVLVQLPQALGELDTLIIRAAAPQHRVQLEDF